MAVANAGWSAGFRDFARGAWRDLGREEAACWAHALRATVAACLALWIALRLDLESPFAAALTAVMVSMPQAGLSMAKSLARLVGTLAGAAGGLLLVIFLAQERDLFLLAIAGWVGLCIAGSSWHRYTVSYAWVLAGYTATMVGFPAYQQPERAFDIAVARIAVVSLGVVCGGILNAVAFPRASRDGLVRAVRSAFLDFARLAVSAPAAGAREAELGELERNLLRDVAALDAARFSTALEDPELTGTGRLDAFLAAFMDASTTAHALRQLLSELARQGHGEVRAALAPLLAAIAEALHGPAAHRPLRAAEAVPAAARLGALAAAWSREADAARARLAPGATPEERLELDGALAVSRQLLTDARALAQRYAELPAPARAGKSHPRTRFRRRPDPLNAAAAGLRGAITLLAVCALWITTAWPDGNYAATAVAVGCGIFAASPRPVHASAREIQGYVIGLAAALLLDTFLLPAAQEFTVAAAVLAPFLLLAGYLAARPATATLAWPYAAMLLTALQVGQAQHYDVEGIVNPILANALGLLAATGAFAVLWPAEGRWRAARLERALEAELRAVAGSRRRDPRRRFEEAVRDLLLQLADLPAGEPAERRRRLLHGMRVLEAGHAALSLRARRERASTRRWAPEIDHVLSQATLGFGARTPERARGAVEELRRVRTRVDAAALERGRASLVALRSSLWLLELALADHASALAPPAPAALEAARAA